MTPKDYSEFTRRLNELRAIIFDGIAYFSCWEALKVGDRESAAALNRYRGLFLPARNALMGMALTQFSKVFDRGARTVSLTNLLRAAKAASELLVPRAQPEELEEIESKLAENEALLTRLKTVRDKRIAHYDSNASGDMKLLYGEMRRFVEDIKWAYNLLRRGHDGVVTQFDSLAGDARRHTSEVVRIMREDMQQIQDRIRQADKGTLSAD